MRTRTPASSLDPGSTYKATSSTERQRTSGETLRAIYSSGSGSFFLAVGFFFLVLHHSLSINTVAAKRRKETNLSRKRDDVQTTHSHDYHPEARLAPLRLGMLLADWNLCVFSIHKTIKTQKN